MNKFKVTIAALACATALLSMGCAGDGNRRSTGQYIDDASLHTRVKAALLNDPVVSGTAINVDVHRGIVSLEGAVNGDVARQKAGQIARGVDGVRGVDNKLVVRTADAAGSSPSVEVEADVDTD